jgi:hypothetical protein
MHPHLRRYRGNRGALVARGYGVGAGVIYVAVAQGCLPAFCTRRGNAGTACTCPVSPVHTPAVTTDSLSRITTRI